MPSSGRISVLPKQTNQTKTAPGRGHDKEEGVTRSNAGVNATKSAADSFRSFTHISKTVTQSFLDCFASVFNVRGDSCLPILKEAWSCYCGAVYRLPTESHHLLQPQTNFPHFHHPQLHNTISTTSILEQGQNNLVN